MSMDYFHYLTKALFGEDTIHPNKVTEIMDKTASFASTRLRVEGDYISMAQSKDKSLLAIGAPMCPLMPMVLVYKLSTSNVYVPYFAQPNEYAKVRELSTGKFGWSVDISPDNKLLVVGEPGANRVWIVEIKEHGKPVRKSPSFNNLPILFGKEVKFVEGHNNIIMVTAPSPVGEKVSEYEYLYKYVDGMIIDYEQN